MFLLKNARMRIKQIWGFQMTKNKIYIFNQFLTCQKKLVLIHKFGKTIISEVSLELSHQAYVQGRYGVFSLYV